MRCFASAALLSFSLTMPASLPSAFAQTSLPSGGGHYSIVQNSKTLGDAQYSVTPIAGGSTLASSGQMKLNTFSYSFNNTATVDAQGNLVRDELTGSVHGAKASGNNIRFDTEADSTGRSFSIRINADGKQTTNQVDRHRNTVLAPDLDPAAYTLMTHIAIAHPQGAWVLIPKQDGILVPAQYTPLSDLRGTLNGQPLTVKHAVVALSDQNSVVIELFYASSGELLEADLNAQNFFVVRDGFKLTNRPKPVAPPAGAPPQADPNQPGQQNGAQPGPQPGQAAPGYGQQPPQ